MQPNPGGGAAVSSGAGYQARVAGYVIVASICGLDSELARPDTVSTVGFETTERVDDINIGLNSGGIVYVQAKAKISFALSKQSDLRSVFCQFERQQNTRTDNRDRFVLVTSGRSSKR